MSKPKVYILHTDEDMERMYTYHGWAITELFKEADMVQFTGGADVTPALYNRLAHPATWADPERDYKEAMVFNACVSQAIPMTGICRGGQFLNCLSGGEMWQDVTDHALFGTHFIVDVESKRSIVATSTHHQMMKPDMERVELVAVAGECVTKELMNAAGELYKVRNPMPAADMEDIEVVWYYDTGALCFQPHPEYDPHYKGELGEYFFECIARYHGLVGEKIEEVA